MTDLINLDEYKIYATIKSVEYDAKITSIITYVSSLIRTYCGRNLIIEAPIVEYYEGGASNLYTKEFPLVSVTSIGRSEDYGQTFTPLVEFTDYVISKSKDQIFIITEDLVELPNKYKITYIGGYEVMPEDLKLAVLDLVDYYYRNEATPKRMSNFVTIEYVKTTDFPPHIKRILDLYRVV